MVPLYNKSNLFVKRAGRKAGTIRRERAEFIDIFSRARDSLSAAAGAPTRAVSQLYQISYNKKARPSTPPTIAPTETNCMTRQNHESIDSILAGIKSA